MPHTMNTRQLRDAHQGALNYSRFDRSDPFAYNRAMSHIHNGYATQFTERNGRVEIEPGYQALEGRETRRLPDGKEYLVTVYSSAKRP